MIRRWVLRAAATVLMSVLEQATPAAGDYGLQVLHSSESHYLLRWTEPGPVDIFVSGRPDAKPGTMRLLVRGERDLQLQAHIPDIPRPYFALRAGNGRIYRIAERVPPLQRGSNFRDLGGYPAAGGKHVRWGLLYRSAAMPWLTDADDRYLSTLGIKTIVDLRSVDERQLSPADWRVKPPPKYIAVDYPGDVLFDRLQGYDGPNRQQVTERLYAEFPVLLRKEYQAMFHELLENHGPVVIQGAAGQDRTGIAVGLILSALGIPRELIYQDYLLSTENRTPANEMADVNLQDFAATNAEARFLIAYRSYAEKARRAHGNALVAQPLKDSQGRPLLQDTFEHIEADYGSVPNYLVRELGVDAADIAKLRTLYLE